MFDSLPRLWMKIINTFAFIITIAFNYWASTGMLNNTDTGDLSDQFPLPITPAGYAFSIWSIIYLGLLVFIIYQWCAPKSKQGFIDRINIWFLLSCTANIAWLHSWHYEQYYTAFPVMLVILITLGYIYELIRRDSKNATTIERIAIYIPFSLYIGWISVATLVNFSQFVYILTGWSETAWWTIIMLILGTILVVAMNIRKKDWAYSFVFVWAYIAIAVKNYENLVIVAYIALASIMINIITLGLAQAKSKK